jgi:hypothetical protein
MLPEPTELAPEHPDDEHDGGHHDEDENDRDREVVGDEPELERERARDREEQVQVDERPGRDEEQLVDDLAADEPGGRWRPG